jgi:hypothetical protein
VVNIILLFRKSSKSMSPSKEAKPIINVINNFYFFEKSSKLVSSSMEAKPNINVVNIFYKIYQIGRKTTQADADRSGFEGLECFKV